MCHEWKLVGTTFAEAADGICRAPMAELAARPDAHGCVPCNPACRPACDAPAPGNRATRKGPACLEACADTLACLAGCAGRSHSRCGTFQLPRTNLSAVFNRR